MKTAFITDSGAGLSITEAKELGIFSVPLQIAYDDTTKLDLETIAAEDIVELLKNGKVLKTSLPPAGMIDDLFADLKKEGYQRVFCICITKGLSSTADTFFLLAKQHDLEFIFIDCYSTAYIQQYAILYAKQLYEENRSIEEIKTEIQKLIDNANTLIIPANLDQIRRSGRLTGVAATIAGLLKIRPLLKVNIDTAGKIDAISKARTSEKLINETISIMKEKINSYYKIYVAHVDAAQQAQELKEKLQVLFGNAEIEVKKLLAPIAAHAGLGCVAIQYFPKLTTAS